RIHRRWRNVCRRGKLQAHDSDVESVQAHRCDHDGEQQTHEDQRHPERRVFGAESQQLDKRVDDHALPLRLATGTTPYCTPCCSKRIKPASSTIYTTECAAMPTTKWLD